MTSFENRISKGKKLEEFFINYLNLHGIDYLLTGYENLVTSKGAIKKLQSIINDNTSYFIRYYPDFIVVVRNKAGNLISCLVEVKNSSGIEKECYDNYLKLKDSLDVNILMFMKNKKLCRIEDLVLSDVSEYDSIADMNIPIIDGKWKVPRNMTDDDYKKYINAYKKAGKYTSGCSFAFIDFQNTKFYNLDILRSYH